MIGPSHQGRHEYNEYIQACLVSTLKGTPNLYFLSEVFAISTGGHSVHELGTEWSHSVYVRTY